MNRQIVGGSTKAAVGVKVAVICLATAFVLINVYAYSATPINSAWDLLRGPIAALKEDIVTNRWVTVIVSDLILGWFLTALAIWHFRERRWTAALWIAGVFGIGNLVTALYVLANYDRVAALVRHVPGSSD